MIVNGTKLAMIRGDTELISVSMKNEAGVALPFEVGDIVYFTVKKSVSTETILLQKIIEEFNEGVAEITIEPDDTKELAYGTYKYDVQFNRGTEVKTIVAPSGFEIMGEVTYD